MSNRYDERDTMFSRMFELEEGSNSYTDYYNEHPDREELDRKLRSAEGGVFADRLIEQRQIDATFSLLADLRQFAGHGEGGAESANTHSQLEIEPADASERLKKTVLSYGAVKCGIADTNPDWLYSVRGRGRHYKQDVKDVLPATIVFAVEMDETEINRAPAVEQSVEVVRGYMQAAVIGLTVKRIINSWGYRAICHMDGESQIILPPAAEAAGLGSIGLNGLLVTKECGPRLRLAAVTTDLQLLTDPASGFNVRKFCKTCGRCADACPSASIRKYDDYDAGGRFSINHETCFGLWREMATDCGVCLAVCPFSHPDGEKKKAAPQGFLKDMMFGKN
ncbi:MAG TPA: hypothetical protein DCO79_01250 [Spirochaeta sp.]|nr:hypothetical protein [Spirochaeta sp.]